MQLSEEIKIIKKKSEETRYNVILESSSISYYNGIIKTCEDILPGIENLEKENEELKQQINSLKCCQNCRYCDKECEIMDCTLDDLKNNSGHTECGYWELRKDLK